MYYVPSDPGLRTVSLNRFNNGPDHRDSARLVLPGYEIEGPLGFPWVRNDLPGLKPLLEGLNPATGDYSLMHTGEQLPGYNPASLRVFGYL